MTRRDPPGLWRALLRVILPEELRDEVVEDLRQLWAQRRSEAGPGPADRWYRCQVLRAIGPALVARLGRPGSDGAGGGTTTALRHDLRFALRQFRRQPAMTVIVTVTLALGIGAATAIFSVVDAVLLESLPYEDPSELVMITSRAGTSEDIEHLAGPDLVEMEEQARGIEEAGFFLEATVGPMTEVDAPQHVLTVPVSWNLFSLLGIEPARGRLFNADDAVPGSDDSTDPAPVAGIVSQGFWQRSLGGDPDVLGRTIHIWGEATRIVGVLPEGAEIVVPPELNIPQHAEVWVPLRWDPRDSERDSRPYRVVARMAAGASVPSLQAELDRFARTLRQRHPVHATDGTRFRVAGLREAADAPLAGALWILMGAVTLVLLIACANVVNLLLARGGARAREIGVRAALGAGRRRLVKQLLTENAVLAGAGAVGGVLLAQLGIQLLHALRPADLQRLESAAIDLRVLTFSVLVTVAATLLSGLLPAWISSRHDLRGRMGNRGSTGSERVRRTLIVFELALSVTLLAGAGLLLRTFDELRSLPLGFEPDGVWTVTATQSPRSRSERQGYETAILDAARAVPGVRDAAIVFPLPMNGVYERTAEYVREGRDPGDGGWSAAYFRTVSPTYFQVMGLELRRGRHFERTDEAGELPVVIIDERLARREFGGSDPIGRALHVRGMTADTLRAQVVGVVEYAPQGHHLDTRATMYFPRSFYLSHEVSLVARADGQAERMGTPLTAAIRAVDRSLPLDAVPMESFVRDRLARSRFLLTLMQAFGVLALGLSAVGLYGVLSYSVKRRTKEMGLRLALGAKAGNLVARVVGGGLAMAAIGIVPGILGSLALGRLMRAQLFQVDAADPAVLFGAVSVVLLVTAVASLVPASRAARTDPRTALTEE